MTDNDLTIPDWTHVLPSTLAETKRAIDTVETALGLPYLVPAEVALMALERWYSGLDWNASRALLDIGTRYVGHHTTLAGVAYELAGHLHSGIDFAVWPFDTIDWRTAGEDLRGAITHGSLVEIGDHEWFDRS